jgi:hypothetical protein
MPIVVLIRPRAIASLLLAVMFASACGTSSSPNGAVASGAETSSTAAQAATQAQPTPSASPATQMPNRWTYEVTEPQGYVIGGILEDGSVQHLTPGLSIYGLAAGSVCQVNPTTDGVIPARFTMVNHTANFPLNGAIQNISLGNVSRNAGGFLQVEVGYTTPECITDRMTISSGTLAPGLSVRANMFFILAGYYSPAYPSGNPAMLKQAQVIIGELGALKVTGTGPGIETGSSEIRIPLAQGK